MAGLYFKKKKALCDTNVPVTQAERINNSVGGLRLDRLTGFYRPPPGRLFARHVTGLPTWLPAHADALGFVRDKKISSFFCVLCLCVPGDRECNLRWSEQPVGCAHRNGDGEE